MTLKRLEVPLLRFLLANSRLMQPVEYLAALAPLKLRIGYLPRVLIDLWGMRLLQSHISSGSICSPG